MLSTNAKHETQLPAEPAAMKHASSPVKGGASLPPITVEQIMTREVVAVSSGHTFEDLARLMVQQPFHHFPVVEDDRTLAGVISERDILLLMAKKKNLQGMNVRELMTKAPVTAQPRTSLSEAARKMLAHRFDCLPVVDADGKLCGVVTSTDLLNAFQKLQACVERATEVNGTNRAQT